MNKQQVELAIGSGLELLGEKSEVSIPVRLNDGIFLLKQLLHLIASGQLGLQPTVQTDPPAGDSPPDAILPKAPRQGPPNPRPNPAARRKRPVKKASKKK